MDKIVVLLVVAVCVDLGCSSDAKVLDPFLNSNTFIASVFYQGEFQEIGTVVNRHWVLTTATGVHRISEQHCSFTVRVGSGAKDYGGTIHQGSGVQVHPKYDHVLAANGTCRFDFALIKVDTPICLVEPAYLPFVDSRPPPSTTVLRYGWEKFEHDGGMSSEYPQAFDVLSTHEEHTMSSKYVVLGMPSAHDYITTVSKPDDISACLAKTDYGAPLIYNGTLFGLLASQECQMKPFVYSFYSPIANQQQWIESVIWN